jgi:hypothetical protein
MAKKKSQAPAKKSQSSGPASSAKKSKPPTDEGTLSNDLVLTDQFEESLIRFESRLPMTASVLRSYARFSYSLLRLITGISNSPIGKQMLGRRLEMEQKREDATNAQLLAKAEIDRAIAKRIETAESVEIEETFDASAKGHAGVSKDDKGAQMGIGGEGQRVVKRKIILKGTAANSASAHETSVPNPTGSGKSSLPQPPIHHQEESHDKSAS